MARVEHRKTGLAIWSSKVFKTMSSRTKRLGIMRNGKEPSRHLDARSSCESNGQNTASGFRIGTCQNQMILKSSNKIQNIFETLSTLGFIQESE